MRGRQLVTLFPFLSVLVSTMGVLSFLAVTFLLFIRQEQTLPKRAEPVEVNWVGAPEHVRPVLVECRDDGVVFHRKDGGPSRFFPREDLEREVAVVKELERRAREELRASVVQVEAGGYHEHLAAVLVRRCVTAALDRWKNP